MFLENDYLDSTFEMYVLLYVFKLCYACILTKH